MKPDLSTMPLLLLFLLILLSPASANAFNEDSKALISSLFEKKRVATDEELIEMLIPIAQDETLPHMKKIKDMSFVVYISGHRPSKAEKSDLFFDVFEIIEDRRVEAYLKEHPDLGKKKKDAIRKNRVFIGMSKKEVEASLGKPEEIRLPMGSFVTREKWSYYTKRMTIYFKDGLLTSLKQH
ncbi:MAG: hypothetical protein ACE5GK_02910 [Nitrospiria bacterium]